MKREILIKFRGKRVQAEMARLYGVSQQAWSMWERGEKKPSVLVMKRLEDDIGIPMEEIFFDVFSKEKFSAEQKLEVAQ